MFELPLTHFPPKGLRFSFVAMQYHTFMLNRTYLVMVSEHNVCGAVVRGIIPSPPLVTARWYDPASYPRQRKVNQYAGVDLDGPDFLSIHRSNFRLPLREIVEVEFVTSPKWGMGNVPYSGRLWLHDSKKRHELILLGKQDGPLLANRLREAVRTTS